MTLRIWREPAEVARLTGSIEGADAATTAWLSSPPELDDDRTVAEQAVAAAVAQGLREPVELADYVVDLLDAEALLDKPTWHFSRGERQMAGLIVVFARPFERLVLIDPTAGLDRPRSIRLARFIADLADDVVIDVASDSDVFADRDHH